MVVSATAYAAIGLVVAIAAFLSSYLRITVDPREPPVVHPKVPFFGHLIGMFREGPLYFKRVRQAASHYLNP
jgi:hypothetical protein